MKIYHSAKNNLYTILILAILGSCIFACSSNKNAAKQVNSTATKPPTELSNSKADKPVMFLKPSSLKIGVHDRLIAKEITVMNRGTGTLTIDKIDGSCGCSKATVTENNIVPMTLGKVILYIDLNGLYDNKNVIEYTFYSNASNSPQILQVKIDTTLK